MQMLEKIEKSIEHKGMKEMLCGQQEHRFRLHLSKKPKHSIMLAIMLI